MFRHYGTVSFLSFHDFYFLFRLNSLFPFFPLRSNSAWFFGLGFLIGASLQGCGAETIFFRSGSGSDFQKVSAPAPEPAPAPA